MANATFVRSFNNPTGYLLVEGISPSGSTFTEHRQILGDPQAALDRIRSKTLPDSGFYRDPTPGATIGTVRPPTFGDRAGPVVKTTDQFFGGVRVYDAKKEGITGIIGRSPQTTKRQPPTPNATVAAKLQAEDNNQTLISTPQQKATLGIGAAVIVAWLLGIF